MCFPGVFQQIMTGIVVNFVCSRQTAFRIRVLSRVFEGGSFLPQKSPASPQKFFPSTMERKLNEDLTRFTQTLSRLRQDRGGEKNALLVGFLLLVRLHFFTTRFSFERKAHCSLLFFVIHIVREDMGLNVSLQPMRCTAVKTKNQPKAL